MPAISGDSENFARLADLRKLGGEREVTLAGQPSGGDEDEEQRFARVVLAYAPTLRLSGRDVTLLSWIATGQHRGASGEWKSAKDHKRFLGICKRIRKIIQ